LICHVRVVECGQASVPPQPGERFVDCDPRQPGRETRAAGEVGEMGEGVDVCLLHHVFSLVVAAHDRAHGAKEPLVVPSHHQFEARNLPRTDAADQIFVGL
jgi:hypothetical protein